MFVGSFDQQLLVEEYRDGYPRYCALIAANEHFFICRRFLRLRSKVLLLKQDNLCQLQQQLDDIDQNETLPLFLGKSRGDRNTDRTSLLSEISKSLDDYGMIRHGPLYCFFNSTADSFLDRTYKILSFDHAPTRDVLSLQNWVDGTGCLSREETEYLKQGQELMSLAPPSDGAMKQFEDWVEDLFIRYYKDFRTVGLRPPQKDDSDASHSFLSTTGRPIQMSISIQAN